MKISIDGNTDILSADEGYSLDEIFRQIMTFLATNGRRTVSAMVDGKRLSQADTELMKKPVDDFDLLEITSLDVRKQAVNALAEVRLHLPGIVRKVIQVSEQIQTGNLVPGYKTLGGCADLLNMIIRVIEEVRSLIGIELNTLDLKGDSAADRLEKVRDVLEETRQALDSRDTVTVADLMEYELAPGIEGWDRILECMIEEVKK